MEAGPEPTEEKSYPLTPKEVAAILSKKKEASLNRMIMIVNDNLTTYGSPVGINKGVVTPEVIDIFRRAGWMITDDRYAYYFNAS